MAAKRKIEEPTTEESDKKQKAEVKKDDKKTKMEYRYLGRSGLRVSVLSFGAWVTWGNQVGDEVAYDCLLTAWKQGCNFFDNAEAYCQGKAEEVMGRCFKRLMSEEGVTRSDFVVSTKIFWGGQGVNRVGLSRKHIIEGTKLCLSRLGLDHVDIIFAHRPDPDTPIEETVRAFNYVIDKGQAFYWGTSEWSADQINEAAGVASRLGLIGPVVEQTQYSLLHRKRIEVEYSRLYKEIGLGLTVWSPLASGLLTGKYTSKDAFPEGSRLALDSYKWLKEQLLSGQGMNGLEIKSIDDVLTKVKALHPIADKLGCTLPQLALAWCISNPNVSTVLTGASKSSQIIENFAALEFASKITPAIKEEIDKVLDNKPVPVKNYKG